MSVQKHLVEQLRMSSSDRTVIAILGICCYIFAGLWNFIGFQPIPLTLFVLGSFCISFAIFYGKTEEPWEPPFLKLRFLRFRLKTWANDYEYLVKRVEINRKQLDRLKKRIEELEKS